VSIWQKLHTKKYKKISQCQQYQGPWEFFLTAEFCLFVLHLPHAAAVAQPGSIGFFFF
jgi:hypothetical protein